MPVATDPPIIKRRRRRFVRTSEPPTIALTSRDDDILRFVAEFDFVNSRQILAMIPGSEDKVLRRLGVLYHDGLLERPRAQIDYYVTEGSSPMVYTATEKAIRHLNTRDGGGLSDYRWKLRDKPVGRPFLEHALAITGIHVALVTGTRARPEVEHINEASLIAAFPIAPQRRDKAFAYRTPVRRNGQQFTISVNPDYSFALQTEAIGQRAYLAEIDRGTMPIERAGYDQTSILRKLDTYIHGHTAKLYEQNFGWKALRYLFVTTNAERATHMRTIALANLTKNPAIRRLFYFTHVGALANSNILDHVWTDGNGDPQTLI